MWLSSNSADQRSHSARKASVMPVRGTEPQQRLGGRRRRAGPGVHQRDGRLAPRERLVEHRQVTDDDRQEAQPQARLDDGQHPAERLRGKEVAVADREEGDAAVIAVAAEIRWPGLCPQRRGQRPVQQGEAEQQGQQPGAEQGQQRQRTEDAQEGLAILARLQPASQCPPQRPGKAVKNAREPTVRDPPRQQHRLEAIHEDDKDDGHTQPGGDEAHVASFPRAVPDRDVYRELEDEPVPPRSWSNNSLTERRDGAAMRFVLDKGGSAPDRHHERSSRHVAAGRLRSPEAYHQRGPPPDRNQSHLSPPPRPSRRGLISALAIWVICAPARRIVPDTTRSLPPTPTS